MESKDKLIEQEAEKAYKKASEQYTYPKGVINNEDYDNYLLLTNQWKNHIQRYYKNKSKNVEIDLAQPTKYIEEEIKKNKISDSEAELIKKINLEIYSIVMKATLFKKRAFGDTRVGIGENGDFIPDEISMITPIAIDLFGRFYKVEEVHQVIQQDLEIVNVSIYQLKNIYKDNVAKIKELQDKFKSSYSDCRLGYKRSRLEELQYLYNERKQIYSNDKSRENEKQLQSLLESIKKECDGDLVINGNFNVTVENQADLFVKQEILKELNISMFVLSRIAGRMNVNPLFLLSRLANSRYSQFSGYSPRGLSPTSMTDEIDYPSNLIYNWSTIKSQNESQVQKDEQQSALPEIQNVERVLSLKEQLLQKLALAKRPLNDGKGKVEGDSL